MKIKLLPSLLLILLLPGCGEKPEVPGFNEADWKADKFACKNKRSNQSSLLLTHRKSLQGVSENDLVKLLGSPDKQEIYSRGIKNLIYYTHPGGQCKSNAEVKEGRRIIIELNALGNVTWINEENI